MPSSLHTPLCDLLGCRYPILQTGMGWVATPELVAAVCNAGAFGFLAAAPFGFLHCFGRLDLHP